MSELAETIERVVREVLAGMGHTVVAAQVPAADPRANGESTAIAASSPKADSPLPPAPQESTDRLVLNRRVVTLADLPERLAAVQRVIVPLGTVVTPSVQDELQKRQIKLVVGEPAAAAEARESRVVLMVAATAYDPAPLAAALEREGFPAESRHMDCLIRATDQLAGDLAIEATSALLLTAHAAAAMCLANRHAGVRAILGTRADTVARDADSVGANLLVVDPTALGFFAIKQMASRFLRGGPRSCPQVFGRRLGTVQKDS
jgi:hypothetical protein